MPASYAIRMADDRYAAVTGWDPTAALTQQFSDLAIYGQSEVAMAFNPSHVSYRGNGHVVHYSYRLAISDRKSSYNQDRASFSNSRRGSYGHSFAAYATQYALESTRDTRYVSEGFFDGGGGGGSGGLRSTPPADVFQQRMQQASTSGTSDNSGVDISQDGSIPVLGASEEVPEATSNATSSSAGEAAIDRGVIGTTNGVNSSTEPARPALLACPYIKQKPNCPRCHGIFKTEGEVANHLKEETLCKVIQGEGHVEGFDAAQEKLLESKKRKKGVETEEDKWREIFKILFPSHKDMPGPFYNTPLYDQSATDRTSKRKRQEGVERIFTRNIPSPVEVEMFSRLEEAVEGRLSKKKRRKIMDAFREFAVKMLRHYAEGNFMEGTATLTSKSVHLDKTDEITRANENIEEKVDEKPVRLDLVPNATESTESPTESAMTLYTSPTCGVEQTPSCFNLEGYDFGNDLDMTCWPLWDAAFANGNEDDFQPDIKTCYLKNAPADVYEGGYAIPRQAEHVIGEDTTS
ncbi:hypothetical protein CSAL01_02777 [Colletotrichum salicis]|uniref:C2H2-type domain-containing protein n=1 Tax=Colletotrichum salicis TaxID=1209931 RepID=A0A135RWK7_9PEZI|nr:hypothetical protein CSAL01_02777 [Colletotrichum salicis]